MWPFKRETRAAAYVPGFSVSGTTMAGPVDPPVAEGLATIQACIQAIASGLASLPAYVRQTQPDGSRTDAPGHPVSRIIRQPSERQTWPDWLEMTLGEVLLWGNSLSEVVYDGAHRPVALLPIPWRYVRVVVLPSGRLAFDVVQYTAPWGGSGQPRRLLDSDVFYLKDRSDNGYTGRSRISRSPEVIAAAAGLQQYSTSVWHNAAAPSGIVTFAPGMALEAKKRLVEHFGSRFTGARNAKQVVYAEGDAGFKPISVSPEDSEVLASRAFTVTELCRIMGVPPPIIQDYSNNTFTNAAQAELWFASRTLLPWARKIEAEFQRSLFADPSYSLEIDLSGLLRGDYTTLMTTNTAAVAAGILTVDEARDAAGYGPKSPQIEAK